LGTKDAAGSPDAADDGGERPGGDHNAAKSSSETADQKPPEAGSSLREKPSYGDFDSLATELDARAQSRDEAKSFNKTDGIPESQLKNSEPGAGVEHLDDLPAGRDLLEADEDERSRLENLRAKLFKNSSDIDDRVQSLGRVIDKAFGERPRAPAKWRDVRFLGWAGEGRDSSTGTISRIMWVSKPMIPTEDRACPFTISDPPCHRPVDWSW
jgi:hypothetical protein